MQSYKVVLSTTTEFLGTAPNNPQVYADFIVAKRMAEGKFTQEEIDKAKEEELAVLPTVTSQDDNKGVTVFRRSTDGTLVIPDYMIRGYLKSAAASLSEGWGMAGKIDRMIHVGRFHDNKFIPDRFIPMIRDGVALKGPDGYFERPLRAMTAQGERISLASSEVVNPVVKMAFHLTVLPLAEKNKGIGTKEKPLLIDQSLLEFWFSYGQMSGLGQFRNGSFGRFTVVITKL